MESKNFVIDRHCEATYDYFGLEKIVSISNDESYLICHIKSVLNNVLSYASNVSESNNANDVWIEEMEQSEAYKMIGGFGEVKFLKNQNPQCVCKENFKNLSVLLEVELYKKAKTTDPILLPMYIFQDHLRVFSIYQLKNVVCDVKSFLKKKTLSIYQISFLIFNLLKGVQFLHSNRIMHRNIVAENVFVFGNEIKIGNFNCAALENNSYYLDSRERKFPFCSPDYFKPEAKITRKVDIWAIGLFACYLWTNVEGTPFLRQGTPGSPATAESMLNLNFDTNLVVLNDCQGGLLSLDQFNFLDSCLNQNYILRASVFDLLTHSVLEKKKRLV